jgi:hypothetical protein
MRNSNFEIRKRCSNKIPKRTGKIKVEKERIKNTEDRRQKGKTQKEECKGEFGECLS